MGDIADYYMDLAMEEDAKMEANIRLRQDALDLLEKHYMMGILKWTTLRGKKIMVTDMSTLHIENSIKMIKRNGYKNKEISRKWVEILEYELEKDSDKKTL